MSQFFLILEENFIYFFFFSPTLGRFCFHIVEKGYVFLSTCLYAALLGPCYKTGHTKHFGYARSEIREKIVSDYKILGLKFSLTQIIFYRSLFKIYPRCYKKKNHITDPDLLRRKKKKK
jgi:hypothetical protein